MLRKITTYEGYFERFIATLSPKKSLLFRQTIIKSEITVLYLVPNMEHREVLNGLNLMKKHMLFIQAKSYLMHEKKRKSRRKNLLIVLEQTNPIFQKSKKELLFQVLQHFTG